MKKRSERRKHCVNASCSKARTPPTRPLSQTHRQDRLQYTAPQLASVQPVMWPGHAHLGVVLYYIRRRGPSSISVPYLKRIAQIIQKLLRGSWNFEIRSHDPGHAHLGVVLWSLRREAPSCMSVPNLKRIALFVQKLLGRSQNYEIRSCDPSHAHLAVVLWFLCREAPSCMSVPNLKRIALFVQKLLDGPKLRPATDTLPGGAGPPKFNQLEMVTTCTYRPSLAKIDARNFKLSW